MHRNTVGLGTRPPRPHRIFRDADVYHVASGCGLPDDPRNRRGVGTGRPRELRDRERFPPKRGAHTLLHGSSLDSTDGRAAAPGHVLRPARHPFRHDTRPRPRNWPSRTLHPARCFTHGCITIQARCHFTLSSVKPG